MTGSASVRRWANVVFFMAVIAINFTLSRPSPVDILLIVALVLTLCAGQVITTSCMMFLGLLAMWLTSFYASSLWLIDDPEVTYQMLKITFAISIGICSALISSHWTKADFHRFLQAYVASACIAATLGTVGFLLSIEDLTWDGRGKGYFDDPNMYAAFLTPAILACIYQLSRRDTRKAVYVAALVLIAVGVLMSFSRVSIVGCTIWALVLYLFLNRRRLAQAATRAALLFSAIAVLTGIVALSDDGFAAKLADRSTVAKEYDLGHGGRYSRYGLAIPIMLDNPLGIGLLQIEHIFDEPLHNIVLNSFVNFGWLAGFAIVALAVFSVVVSLKRYRRTREPIFVFILLCWASVFTAALVHEAERWRHLWLFTGLVWGLRPGLIGAAAEVVVPRLARVRRARPPARPLPADATPLPG